MAELIARWRNGDQAAAEAIVRQFGTRLIGLAQQNLARRLSPRIDGEDIVQSVFRTFFRRLQAGQFSIDGDGQLWQLLVTITLRKARARGRHHTAERRSVRAEGGDADLTALAAREPGPEDAAIVLDQMSTIVRDLPPPYAEILQLRLEGCEVVEIARRMELSRRTIHRAILLLQSRLETIDRHEGGENAQGDS